MKANQLGGVFTALTGIAARGGGQVILLVVTLVAARFLSPTDFGVFALASVGVTLVRTLLYSGAFEYQLKTEDRDAASTECLLVNLALSIAVSLILIGLSFFSKAVFGVATVGALILAMAPSNLLAAVTAWQESQVLRAGRLRGYYLVTTIGEVCSAGVAIALLMGHQGLYALVSQLYVRAAVLLVGYLILKRTTFSEHFSVRRLNKIVRWSISRYGAVLLSFVTTYGADVLLGIFLSPAASGLYRASSRIVGAVTDMFAQPTRILAATLFSARAAVGESSADLWPRIVTSATFIGWSALAGLAVVAPTAVPIVLGPQWTAAAPIVTILCLARAFNMLDAVTNPLLVTQNRQKTLLAMQTGTSIVLIAGLFAFAHYGTASAAWVVTAIDALVTCSLLWLCLRSFPEAAGALRKGVLVALAHVLAVSVVAFSVQPLMRHVTSSPLWQLIGAIATGGVAWGLVAFVQRRAVVDALRALSPSRPASQPT